MTGRGMDSEGRNTPAMADDKHTRFVLAWALAFAIAAVWPVLVFPYPAAQDAPNHLARAFILLNPNDPVLSRQFEIVWHAMPDLAWDVFALVAGQVMPLVAALKTFMILGLALPVLGIALINRQIAGRWTYMPLYGIPFLFHSGYSKGFLGFNVSIGMTLIGIAIWMAFSERRWGWRLALGWLVSSVLFFAHLVAWAIYGLTILGLKLAELHAAWRKTGSAALGPWLIGLVRDGSQVLPPLAIMGITSVLAHHEVALVGEVTEFQPPWRRLIEAWHIIDTGAYFPAILVLAIVAPLLFYLLLKRRVLRFDPALAVPIGLLVAMFFVVPNQIFATHYIVWRIALGATYLALASCIPVLPVTAPVMRNALGISLAGVLALTSWQAYSIANASAERADFAALIARIPEGDTLFAVHADLGSEELEFDRIGLYHFAADAVRTEKIMAQSMFANPAQQPIRYREARFDNPRDNGRVFMSDLRRNLEAQGISVAGHVRKFNWVAIHGPTRDADRSEVPLDGFAFVGEQGRFRLYCQLGKAEGGSEQVCPDGKAP